MQREEKEVHEEPCHPTQPSRLDAVDQRSDSAFARIVQSWKAQFLQLTGPRELRAKCGVGGVLFLSEQNNT